MAASTTISNTVISVGDIPQDKSRDVAEGDGDKWGGGEGEGGRGEEGGGIGGVVGGEENENKPLNYSRLEEFGLGRGVDATDPTPFLNKKPFQVLPVDSESSIFTDLGGALEIIFHKIERSDSQTAQLAASFTAPKTPITIGAAIEHSRKITQRGYTLGRKVITRSIEFRKDLSNEKQSFFEKWLIERKYYKKDDPIPSEGLVQFLIDYGITHYVTKIQLGAAEYRTMSETNYSSFISGKQTLGVDKIADLALSMSGKKEQSIHNLQVKRIGFMNPGFVVRRGTYDEAVVDVQLESILNLISDEDLKDRLSTALHIYADHHGRYDIGWRKPCEADLIAAFRRPLNAGKEPDGACVADEPDGHVVSAYNNAVRAITNKFRVPPTQHQDGYKYAICCKHGKKRLYLSIAENNQVIAVENSKTDPINYFNLLSTENPHEFVIVDYKKVEVKTEEFRNRLYYDFWPTPRYLKVKTHLGYNCGPLSLEDSVDEYYCRLKLRPRLYRTKGTVTLNDFANGKDTYYICTAGRYGKTGYVYLRDRGERGEVEGQGQEEVAMDVGEHIPLTMSPNYGTTASSQRATSTESQASSERARYVTACKPFIKRGNEDDLMLFRLVRYESMYELN